MMSKNPIIVMSNLSEYQGARGSAVVKALCYKPETR
jgi:hypothetical protein